jgi:hypothetical protein
MGNRANIKLDFGKRNDREGDYDPIYLYTHWDGSTLPATLQVALAMGSNRWGDESYLARIIFSHMIADNVYDETGYGISPYETDNQNSVITVHLPDQTVEINGKTWTFPDYCEANIKSIEEVYRR